MEGGRPARGLARVSLRELWLILLRRRWADLADHSAADACAFSHRARGAAPLLLRRLLLFDSLDQPVPDPVLSISAAELDSPAAIDLQGVRGQSAG